MHLIFKIKTCFFFFFIIFFSSYAYAKSLSNEKEDYFCLPKDISNGFGCNWKSSSRTLGEEHQIKIVSKDEGHPVKDGNLSLRFEVRPGECGGKFDGSIDEATGEANNDCDRVESGASERAELKTKPFKRGESWYSWSIYIPEGQEIFNPGSLKIGQFHSTIQKYIQQSHWEHNDGKYTFINPVCGFECKGKSINIIGKWTDIVINVNWSENDKGFYNVWADGKMIYDYEGPTLYEKKNKAYLKLGIYRGFLNKLWNENRDGGISVVYFDDIKYAKNLKKLNLNYELDKEVKYTDEELREINKANNKLSDEQEKVKKYYLSFIVKKIAKKFNEDEIKIENWVYLKTDHLPWKEDFYKITSRKELSKLEKFLIEEANKEF